jgi:phosphoribosylglycinamide formyltransferase 1
VRAPLAVGVLVSGAGTTLEGLAHAAARSPGEFRIALVVADRAGIPALARASGLGLRSVVIPSRGVDPERWSHEVTAALESAGVELVIFAGFLSIFPASWVARWRGRAVNLHPSLLPRHGGRGMYGRHVHEAVLASGDTETGATVHLVTGDVDGGPPIAQRRVPVLPGDTPETLRERLRPVEIELLATTVRRFADGSLPLPYRGEEAPARDARTERERRD